MSNKNYYFIFRKKVIKNICNNYKTNKKTNILSQYILNIYFSLYTEKKIYKIKIKKKYNKQKSIY